MKLAVPKEVAAGERRVALVPSAIGSLAKEGLEVAVERGAGEGAFFSDEAYTQAGANVVADVRTLLREADVVVKVQPPARGGGQDGDEVGHLREGAVLVGLLQPLTSPELVKRLAAGGITSFAMEAVPRIARAQKMDALSSMASLAGYKAAVIAADTLSRYFPMMITAAGTFAPAKGLVLGAGVAGLQAIATAGRLGAVMHAFDVRPAVKEQVQSLGARFIEEEIAGGEDAGGYAAELSEESRRKERELLHRHVREMDFVISTAAVPGRPAPLLITKEMVWDMRPGSVIVDLAAETGGNCELTKPGETVVERGVTVLGPVNLPSAMATQASQMYARNVSALLLHLVKKGALVLDLEDEITRGCCITHQGRVVHQATQARLGENPQDVS